MNFKINKAIIKIEKIIRKKVIREKTHHLLE